VLKEVCGKRMVSIPEVCPTLMTLLLRRMGIDLQYIVYWNSYAVSWCERGYSGHSPLTTTATLDWQTRSDLDGAAADRRGRRECQRRSPRLAWLVTPEDGRPTEAQAMILPLTPDEALVVDVARGRDSGRDMGSLLAHFSVTPQLPHAR